jgi:tRNA-splicing ligase RtcB
MPALTFGCAKCPGLRQRLQHDGRVSGNAAKKRFSTRDLEDQTRGVECRKDAGVVDEVPGAYKPIEQVMEQQTDLVEVVAKLKQVICVKG